MFLLIIITAITKLFGFAREILLEDGMGSEQAEAFKIAQTIPMLLLLIVGTEYLLCLFPFTLGLKG